VPVLARADAAADLHLRCRALAFGQSVRLVPGPGRDRILGPACDLARALARDLARALGPGLGPARERGLTRGLVRGLVRDLNLGRVHVRRGIRGGRSLRAHRSHDHCGRGRARRC